MSKLLTRSSSIPFSEGAMTRARVATPAVPPSGDSKVPSSNCEMLSFGIEHRFERLEKFSVPPIGVIEDCTRGRDGIQCLSRRRRAGCRLGHGLECAGSYAGQHGGANRRCVGIFVQCYRPAGNVGTDLR